MHQNNVYGGTASIFVGMTSVEKFYLGELCSQGEDGGNIYTDLLILL